MWQAVVAPGTLGFVFLIAVTLAIASPATLAKSAAPIAAVIQHVLGSVVSLLPAVIYRWGSPLNTEVMVIVGAVYLAGLYRGRGRESLAIPGMTSIDAELDRHAVE